MLMFTKKVIAVLIVFTDNLDLSTYQQKSFLLSNVIMKSFTTGKLKITVIIYAWIPLVSIGLLFLITFKWTLMPVLHILNKREHQR